jgi:hypothetical protein
MEDKTGMQESSEIREPTEKAAGGDSHTAEARRGPTWRGWVLSILVAVILSVTATLLLGGSGAFRSDRPVDAESGGYGAGRSCCPPSLAGK